jgi:hypothetical protein
MNLRALAVLLLALCAFPTGTYGQIAGWAQCSHTQRDERLLAVIVALTDGDAQERHVALDMTKEPNGRKVVEFEVGKTDFTVTGMRLTCVFLMPDPALKNIIQSTTVNWVKPIRIRAGGATKLAVLIEEPEPGLRRVGIGRGPASTEKGR